MISYGLSAIENLEGLISWGWV